MKRITAHPCIKQVDKTLSPHNTRLKLGVMFNVLTGREREVLLIATEKVDPSKRRWMKNVAATYCPFCGKKIVEG